MMIVKLADYLETGRANATRISDLAMMLHCTPRDIQMAAERERRAGEPICASSDRGNAGLYLAANAEEMYDYCKRLYHRSGEVTETLKACEITAALMMESEMAENGDLTL